MWTVEVALPGRARPVTCATDDAALELGDRLIVEDGPRTLVGVVSRVPLEQPWPPGSVLPRVVRPANGQDDDGLSHAERQRDEFLAIARELVGQHGLPMRMIRADVGNGRKVQFQFLADGRVDFRELVRDLARRLHARVELRQVGVRDAAIAQGGVGHCGSRLCCSSWLPGFAPVSMRMAKAQGLPLNPGKISGQCGRLMCCLKFEIAGTPAAREDGEGSSGAGETPSDPHGAARATCGGCCDDGCPRA